MENRVIKFRAWDKEDELMYYGIEKGMQFEDGSQYTFKDFLENKGYHLWEIMQLTGLCDKEGKEIYEGDIFRIEEDNNLECDFCDGTGTVEGGKYIDTTCEKCGGTGIIDQDDRIFYVVICWVKEWCMFATLTTQELKDYEERGVKGLDEPMFWTYTLEDTDSRKHFLCGNIHQHPHLLNITA